MNTSIPNSVVVLLPLVLFVIRIWLPLLLLVGLPDIELGLAINNVFHALSGENLLHEGLTKLDLIEDGFVTWNRDVVLGGESMKEMLNWIGLPLRHGVSDVFRNLLQKY